MTRELRLGEPAEGCRAGARSAKADLHQSVKSSHPTDQPRRQRAVISATVAWLLALLSPASFTHGGGVDRPPLNSNFLTLDSHLVPVATVS